MTTCGDYGGVKKNGQPCAIVTKEGRCGLHEDGVDRRERLLTDAEITKVGNLAEIACTHEEIAHILGISPRTFARRLNDQEGVGAAYQSGKAKAHAYVKGQLRKKIKNGNTTAIIFYLKTQCGWSEKIDLEHTGPGGGPIQHAMTPQEKANRLAAMLNGAHARSNGA